MSSKEDDTEYGWEKDDDLKQIISYFSKDSLTLSCWDTITWLYPQYEVLPREKERALYDWIGDQTYRTIKYNSEMQKWYSENLPVFFELVEQIIVNNNVEKMPSDFVLKEWHSMIAPWFYQDSKGCIDFLRQQLSLSNKEQLQYLLKYIINDYNKILEFGKELEEMLEKKKLSEDNEV